MYTGRNKQSRKKKEKGKLIHATKHNLDRIGVRLLQSPELQGALPFWGPTDDRVVI
jgi:hypothetical protein